MKTFGILLIVLLIGITACEKSKNPDSNPPQGTYIGTFQRISPHYDSQVSNVILSFFGGKWSGQSDISKYPALCSGAFTVTENYFDFTNACAWTAEFDWSLILSGEYEYQLTGDSLILFKYNTIPKSNSNCDIYRLALPESGIKQSPLSGTWVETNKKTDTIVFAPEYDGIFPVFNLKRGFRITEGVKLPDYFSGPYLYVLSKDCISVNWFLSSNSLYNRFYFKLHPEGNKFEIENFFADPELQEAPDTLTFIKI